MESFKFGVEFAFTVVYCSVAGKVWMRRVDAVGATDNAEDDKAGDEEGPGATPTRSS
jgi:hypothetical protein